jgi:hypothetical protein
VKEDLKLIKTFFKILVNLVNTSYGQKWGFLSSGLFIKKRKIWKYKKCIQFEKTLNLNCRGGEETNKQN